MPLPTQPPTLVPTEVPTVIPTAAPTATRPAARAIAPKNPTVAPKSGPRGFGPANASNKPKDAAEINEMFSRANASERALILSKLQDAPLRASARIPAARAKRAIETLEMAAFAVDVENFTFELSESLILPWRVATEVVNDPGGEPLACAAKALDMPSPVFQRVLLFLKPEFGSSVHIVYRLSRLYEQLSERTASAEGRAPRAAWFETHGVAVLLTMRVQDLILRSIAKQGVSKDEATELKFAPERGAQAFARSRKCRPVRSSVSMIQASGSNRISLARRSSTEASGTGSGDVGMKKRSIGRLSS